jgi:hypothetical protein
MIRGKRLPTAANKPSLYASIHNRFDIEVFDTKTGKIRQRAQAENVICNSFWTRWFGGNSAVGYIHYGSGSGTPSVTDTKLFNFIAAVSYSGGIWDTNHYAEGYISLRNSIQLSETTSVGRTITEVGLAYGTTSTYLTTHAMIQDMNGNPISIEKTNTDIITIYATRFLHWDVEGYDGMEVIPSSLNEYWLGAGLPSASLYAGTGKTYRTSVSCSRKANATTKTLTFTATRMDASSGNIGGLLWLYPGVFVMEAPHTRVTGESVGTGNGTTKNFAVAFEMPYDATVYIDGVAQESGVTVHPAVLNPSEMGYYFQGLDPQSTNENHIPYFDSPPIYSNPAPGGRYRYFYNPLYEIGLADFSTSRSTVWCSNDFIHWTELSSGDIPATYRHYKYWKIYSSASSLYSAYVGSFGAYSNNDGKAIHFDEAPPSGSVITIDYTVPGIPKDSEHVYDFTFSVTLGAYTGEEGI